MTDCELTEQVVSLRGSAEGRPSVLKVPRFLVAARAHAHGVVPTPRGHGPTLRRAVVAHSLATGAAVVLGQLGSELTTAVVAGQDVLVGHPVGRTGGIFYQTYKGHVGIHQHTGPTFPELEHTCKGANPHIGK